MIPRIDDLSDLPGQRLVAWRRSPQYAALACVAGAAWPPLVLTLLFWPPTNWLPGRDIDWRLAVVLIGLIATPVGLWLLAREHQATGKPKTRLGIVWRFMFYGGLLAAGLQTLLTLIMVVFGWMNSGDLPQALGSSETTVLIYGVGGLPIAILVGVSYALWAGLCVAFLAFKPKAPPVRDRLGLMDRKEGVG